MIPICISIIAIFGMIYWCIRYIRAQADRDALSMVVGELKALNAALEYDKARLDWLEQQQERYPDRGGVLFRWSLHGRGWRLHQTTREGSVSTVRGAIDAAMQMNTINLSANLDYIPEEKTND